MPTPADDPSDAARLACYADELAAGVEAALPRWVRGCVERRLSAAGRAADDALLEEIGWAGRAAADDVGPRVRALLARDIDEQRANPLALVREAVRYPTEVLRAAGVAPTNRDPQARDLFPDDDYDLAPASFADLDPALHDVGIRWGAAKAHVHLARRRADR